MGFKFNPFTGNFDLDGDVTINPKTAITPAPADEILVADASDSFAVRKTTLADALVYGQKDLNIGTLDPVFQVDLAVAFCTNAKLYGQYLYILSATVQLVIIDVSNPTGLFLAGQLAGGSSAYNLKNNGSLIASFESNRLRVYSIANVSAPTLLYGPTAAAGNVRSSSDGAFEGSLIYTYNPLTTEFHVIDVSDPALPVQVGAISTGAFTNLQHSFVNAGHYVYATANGIIQVFDVTNPESIVLTSTLNTTTLSSNISQILSIRSLNSFLYCAAKIATTNQPSLLIINKSNPAALTEASLTPLGTSGVSLFQFSGQLANLELFFPFVGINYNYDGLGSNLTDFYDVRYYDAPVHKQSLVSTYQSFTFSLVGNNYYEVDLSGVHSFVLFGTNVSNALVGSVQAGRVEAYGEVSAGFVNVRGSLTCRDNASFQEQLSAKNVQAKNEVTAYRYRQLMRYLMMMGS